jgi:hypothetical protein
MAISEYRIIVTATFSTLAQRDAGFTQLQSVITTWKGQTAGIKQINMTKDDYVIPDAPTTTIPI